MLINGNCLEEMKKLPDKSVDIMICDLPYGETSCTWDTIIDMDEFWIQFKRIRKSKRTACIHFCSTKFGYSLIKSWEKGFKMDMIWRKRNKTGGLQSKHRPMRNHEMVYFFYEQSPKYNRDKYHKRINNDNHAKSEVYSNFKNKKEEGFNGYFKDKKITGLGANFEPVQPGSVLEEEGLCPKPRNTEYSTRAKEGKDIFGNNGTLTKPFNYDPPNPASVLEEKSIYGCSPEARHGKKEFDPPNPASVVEEEDTMFGEKKDERHERYLKCGCGDYEPPNPASVFESTKVFIGKRNHQTEKPQDILEFFLKYWTDEGDVVLDPTMGSGSTGVACKKMNREFIGIELDEKYFNVAKNRIVELI